MNKTLNAALLLLLASCSRPAAGGPEPAQMSQPAAAQPASEATEMKTKEGGQVVKSEEEWKRMLTPEQYAVLRQKGTERAFTGKYWNTKDDGTYVCAGCGAELF